MPGHKALSDDAETRRKDGPLALEHDAVGRKRPTVESCSKFKSAEPDSGFKRSHPALALCLSGLLLAPAARAQVSASLALDSDYRIRGLSLTDRRPVLALNLDSDLRDGVYFGGSALAQHTAYDGVQMLGYVQYLGWAHRNDAGPSWDIGVKNQNMEIYPGRRRSIQYGEVYVGLSQDNISAHIHYSSSAFSRSGDAIYADLDAATPPADRWRLSAHLGVLTPLADAPGQRRGRERYDLAVGVARDFDHAQLRAGWTTTLPSPYLPVARSGPALTLGATVFF